MKGIKDGKMCTFADAPVFTLEDRVQRLEDCFSIRECLYHYAHYCDEFDPAGMSSAFTASVRLSWGVDYGQVVGREAVIAQLKDIFAAGVPASEVHMCGNQQVLFTAPDQAIVNSYLYSWKRYAHADDYQCFGRFELLLIKEADDEWRIDSLLLVQAGEVGGDRVGEYIGRPWPPQPLR